MELADLSNLSPHPIRERILHPQKSLLAQETNHVLNSVADYFPQIETYKNPQKPIRAKKHSAFTLFTKKSVKWIKMAKSAIGELAVQIPLTLSKTTIYVIAAADEIFKNIHNMPSLPLADAKHFSVAGLVTVPITLIVFFDSLVSLVEALKGSCSEAMFSAALSATAAYGDVIEIPAKVGTYANLFTPAAQLGTWAPILLGVSAVLSVASLINSALSHESTRRLVNELQAASEKAVIEKIFASEDPKLERIKQGLKEISFELDEDVKFLDERRKTQKKFKKEFINSFKAISKVNTPEELSALMLKFSDRGLKLDQETWKALLDVGNIAYLDCLNQLESDKKVYLLSRHFQASGEKLSIALEKIQVTNDPKEIDYTVRLLKNRLSYKTLSDKLSFASTTVGLVVQTIFVAIAFGALTAAAGPAVLVVLIAVTIFSLVKMIVDYQKKKEFEKLMGLDLIKAPHENNATFPAIVDGTTSAM